MAASSLSTAQAETYMMLLSMGFDEANAIGAAKIFGSNIEGAVNYITSQPPPTATTHTDTQPIAYSPLRQPKRVRTQPRPSSYTSLDDLAVREYLTSTAQRLQRELDRPLPASQCQ